MPPQNTITRLEDNLNINNGDLLTLKYNNVNLSLLDIIFTGDLCEIPIRRLRRLSKKKRWDS